MPDRSNDALVTSDHPRHYDAVVVGAGFGGLFMLHRLRSSGFSALVLEAADDIGGTWYWNRYPGARCDIPSVDYSFSFDPELEAEWTWSEKYATQPEILAYLHFVADKYQLARDIRLRTVVTGASWADDTKRWTLRATSGEEFTCRFYVMATGCLSVPKETDIDGVDTFEGSTFWTSRWPDEEVDFSGKRVGVIGTGSSGIQSIPIIAGQADQVVVFQRTPTYSFPAHNGPVPGHKAAMLVTAREDYREQARCSSIGVPEPTATQSALQVDDEERRQRYERVWERGELAAIFEAFNDTLLDPASNLLMADFVRGKIRAIVEDPATADLLCPTDFPLATKRPCLDTDYYATFNRPHVRLIDLRANPILTITTSGIETAREHFEFDAIVFATGFDALTGAVTSVDIRGRDGTELRNKWAQGPRSYLGLMVHGFPNLFMITGPQSPSVLSNMVVSIEQHVDWVVACMDHLRAEQLDAIEPTETAEAAWVQHVNDWANITLYPLANSWYIGANVPGKPRVFLPYVAGVARYRQVCADVVTRGYLGFRRFGNREVCNDGIVRRAQADVEVYLEAMAEAGLPPFESLPVDEARQLMVAVGAESPPGPEVGEVIDGQLPGADGPLEYRLYRPPTRGPHAVVVYFHGGGWVLGDPTSDDAYCRDLARRSSVIVISVDYRHAPEHKFPAAINDGFAAVQWIAEHAPQIGGIPGQLAVAGWSAGGNIAAVVSQMARDASAPHIKAQVLIAPVVDFDDTRPSYIENSDGYVLTRSLMRWFASHYVDAADRSDPRAAPLRGELSGLPPAVIVTCELDPLRDGGIAYVRALAQAGTDVKHLHGRGHLHTSVVDVGFITSASDIRARIASDVAYLLQEQVASTQSV